MNPDVTAVLEPPNQHLQTILGKLIAQLGRLDVVVAKVRRGVVLPLTTPEACSRWGEA